jgi:hypothetical protein
MPVWTDAFSFLSGVIRYHDLLYFIATEDALAKKQMPHATILTLDDGTWGQNNFDWNVISVCAVKHPKEQMVAIGEEGNVSVRGSGSQHEETIADGTVSPENRGFLRCVRSIGGKAYAAGMDRQVYRRDGHNTWTCLDAGMRPPKDQLFVGFNAIDGFGDDDIYAVGFQGAIWHYDGKLWQQMDSPTNIVLSSVCCAGDGHVYAAGRLGVLLRGGAGKWEIIDQQDTEEDFWGLAWYQDRLYISTLLRVLSLETGGTLKMVDMDEPVSSAYHLSAADGVLLSTGAKDVMLFDGSSWERIE